MHHAGGDPLAVPLHARLLPRPQQLPLPARRHAGGRHQLPRIHLGGSLVTICILELETNLKFYNLGEGPSNIDYYDLCVSMPMSCLLTMG